MPHRNWSICVGTGLVSTALAASLAMALADKEAPKLSEDLRKMEGTWSYKDPDGDTITYTFKGDQLAVKGKERAYTMTVTLDEAAKPNRAIDMKIVEGPEDAKGKVARGIYKFPAAEQLVICFRPDDKRPEKFEQVGFEQFLVDLTRVKDEKK